MKTRACTYCDAPASVYRHIRFLGDVATCPAHQGCIDSVAEDSAGPIKRTVPETTAPSLDDVADRHGDIAVALLSGDPEEMEPARATFREYGYTNWTALAADAAKRVTDEYRTVDARLLAQHLELAHAMNAVPTLGSRTPGEDCDLWAEKRSYVPRIHAVMGQRAAHARALLARTAEPEQLDLLAHLEETS